MYVPSFAELVGDEDDFFAYHFSKAPYVRRNALAADPKEVLSVADLDEILRQETLRPHHLRIVKAGSLVSDETYVRTSHGRSDGAIVTENVYTQFRSGATIVWNSVQHFRRNLRALAETVAEKLAAPTDVFAFLTPAGGRGSVPHDDRGDVFVLQLNGTKIWRVWPAPEIRSDGAASYNTESLGTPELETALQPGDVLFIPQNAPHVAMAEDAVSLHVSLTAQPATWSALVRLTVDKIIEDGVRLRTCPHLSDGNVLAHAQQLRGALDGLADRLRQVDAEREIRRLTALHTSRPSALDERAFHSIARIDECRETSRVSRTDAELTFRKSADGRVEFGLGGATVSLPESVSKALDAMASGDSLIARDFLSRVRPEESVEVVKKLARLGILAIEQKAAR
ncbi:JmjC domain-containing protein [Microbispora sp. KK1-11]|uniref:JmjC domain-containing protein n=1 Tax=Microbispora sp. KK1-11 TaxID=2053005 RepID=UPI00163C6753|nr:cupin domain-containing protein [Microbispora sp. KK1-11]